MTSDTASARISDEASADTHPQPPASKPVRWLRTKEVAERTSIAEGTLRNWAYQERKTGQLRGPRFFRTETGSVRYLLEDVEEYLNRFRPVDAAA